MSDEPERFVEHPTPDRFFMQIEPAEVEMLVHDHDDVTFKSQLVPGGTFCVELTAKYTYAGRECSQHISLTREAAESLYERLGNILEADPRRDRGEYRADGGGYDDHFDPDSLTLTGEGETWGEAAERLQPDAERDLSCPNGCFELEVTAHHETGAAEELIDRAVQDDPGPCPKCGAAIGGED